MSPTAFTALLEAFGEPVLVVRQDGIVDNANTAALELFGKRIMGAQLRALLRQPDVTAMLERMMAGADHGSGRLCHIGRQFRAQLESDRAAHGHARLRGQFA